jgi:predicted metal-binding membrane protein
MGESTRVSMFLGGWVLMVGAGMVPATLPAARLVSMTRGPVGAATFLLGYAATWIALGVVGFLAFSPLAPAVRWAGAGAVLVVTAAYELSPLKDACLRRCRSPLRVLFQPSLPGGVVHALDCAGCCVFLMALMVALGLMSIGWIALLALVVLAQKAAPFGRRSPAVLAFALAGTAVVTWI